MNKEMQPKVIKYPYVLANTFKEIEDKTGDVRLLSTGINDEVKMTIEEKAGKNLCEGEIVAIPWGGTPNVKYHKGKFVTADNRIATSNDTSELDNKFLYYWMQSNLETIATFYRGSGIKHPSMFQVLSMKIPIPPLPVQQHIVEILDKFDALVNGDCGSKPAMTGGMTSAGQTPPAMTASLPAEISARRKQYEYYRNKLLSF